MKMRETSRATDKKLWDNNKLAQVPFSSVNYGTDTSEEGRLVMRSMLLATEAGLGNGETPIFPIQIFKVKEGVNFNETDPNYDLFKLSCKVSAKRLFPNFAFIDAPFNKALYKEGNPNSEISYMGCRTRVISDINDPNDEVVTSRGNLSFTTINLPRIGIVSRGDINKFYKILRENLELVERQILFRYKIQCNKKVKNFPFLMGQGVWKNSETIDWEDNLTDVLKHGSLSIGFVGLAECLKALIGEHQGESENADKLGYEIVKYLREFCDEMVQKHKLNFTLLATPAESTAGRLVRIDKQKFGEIPGVTDREYYTNSFHVPVYYAITAFSKMNIEGKYHALTNAGHITYVEMDGDPLKNLEAFERIIKYMKECGIGYGAINHPIDRDPVCGYTGVIKNICPKCGREETPDNKFIRIRRITGYLVGTLDRFNNAKKAEERDREKHL